jgi:hypothetical protein
VYVSDKNFVERHLDGEPAEPEPRQTNQRRDTITFPFGHGLVNVNHLVREMVDRRAPIPLDAPQRVQHLRKLVGKGAERTATELTSNELNELEHIFATAGLSDPHGVTRHEWESLYLIAFENAQGKPAWTPWALCSNPKAEVLRQRVAIEKSFRATLAESPTLDLAGNVAPNFDSGGYLLIDEARTRLGRLGFALEDESGEDVSIEQTPAQPAPAPANDEQQGPQTAQQVVEQGRQSSGVQPCLEDPRMRIQAEAAEYWISLLAMNCQPTVHGISKHMAKWCAENEVRTKGNVNPSAGTIRNTILNGKNWTHPQMTRVKAREHVEAKKQAAQVSQPQVAQAAQASKKD